MTTWCIVSKKWQQPFCYVHVNTEMGIRTYNHGKTKAINTEQVLSSKKLANLTWSTLCGVWSKMDNLKWSVAAKKCLSAKMSTVNSVAFLCQLLRQLQPPSAMYKWSLDLEIQNLEIWKSKNCNLQSSRQLQPPSRPMYKWILDLEIQNLEIWKSKICNLQSSRQLQPPSCPMYKWSGCAAGPRTKKEIASEMNCLGWECMQGSPARLSCISVCLSGQEETMDHSKECASCPDFIWDTPDYKSDQDTAYICNWPLCSKGDCLCCCLATINQAFIWSTLISIKCTHHIQVS